MNKNLEQKVMRSIYLEFLKQRISDFLQSSYGILLISLVLISISVSLPNVFLNMPKNDFYGFFAFMFDAIITTNFFVKIIFSMLVVSSFMSFYKIYKNKIHFVFTNRINQSSNLS